MTDPTSTNGEPLRIVIDIDAPESGMQRLFEHVRKSIKDTETFTRNMKDASKRENTRSMENFNSTFGEVHNQINEFTRKINEMYDTMESTTGPGGLSKVTETLGEVFARVMVVIYLLYKGFQALKWGIFQLIELGLKATEAYRTSSGLGASIGGSQAFNAIFGKLGTSDTLKATAIGSYDFTSDQHIGMSVLGVTPKGDTSATALEVLTKAFKFSKLYTDDIFDTVADALYVSRLVSKQTLRMLRKMDPKEFQEYLNLYAAQKDKLELTEDNKTAWLRFTTTVGIAKQTIIASFQRSLVEHHFVDALQHLSDSFSEFAKQFLDIENPDSGINEVMKYIRDYLYVVTGRDDFKGMQTIVDTLKELGDALEYLSKLSLGGIAQQTGKAIIGTYWKTITATPKAIFSTETFMLRQWYAAGKYMFGGGTKTEGTGKAGTGTGGSWDIQPPSAQRITGDIEVEGGDKVRFGSGGVSGFPHVPFGTYEITPDYVGTWGAAHGAMGLNFNKPIWDPSAGRYRSGIEIHPSGRGITEGCIGVARDQYDDLKKKVSSIRSKYGHAYIHVAPGHTTVDHNPTDQYTPRPSTQPEHTTRGTSDKTPNQNVPSAPPNAPKVLNHSDSGMNFYFIVPHQEAAYG